MEIGLGVWFKFGGLSSEEGPVGPEGLAVTGVVGLSGPPAAAAPRGRYVAFGVVGLFGRAFNSHLPHARDLRGRGFLGCFNGVGVVLLAHEH